MSTDEENMDILPIPSFTSWKVAPLIPAPVISSEWTMSPPLIADRTQLQIMDVAATAGILPHIGMNAKLRIVAGTHIFHRAERKVLEFWLDILFIYKMSNI